MKKILSLILAMTMIFTLLAACGGDEPATSQDPAVATSQPGTTDLSGVEVDTDTVYPSDTAVLKVACTGEPLNWNVLNTAQNQQNNAVQTGMLYDTLVNYDASTGELLPNLATSWKWLDDYTLQLKLREDVYSQMGDHFTASDVVYSIQWGYDEPQLASYYANIFDMEKTVAVDEYTVNLATQKVYPYLADELCHPAYCISVEASVEKLGGKAAAGETPTAGTGPYKLEKHVSGQYARFVRRDGELWDEQTPYYKEICYYFVGDVNTRALGLEAGDYDVIETPSMSTCVDMSTNPDFTVWGINANSYVGLFFNSTVEPLNDPLVRQAISLALDRNALLTVAASGLGDITDSCIPATYSGYSPSGTENNYLVYNQELAKQKLAEAGYADGLEISMMYRTTEPMWTKSAEVLQNNLAAIGITLKLDPVDRAVFFTRDAALDFQISMSSIPCINAKRTLNSLDVNDYNGRCGDWLPEGQKDLIEKCLTTVDADERQEYLAQLQDVARELVPTCILFSYKTTFISSSEIINLTMMNNGYLEPANCYTAEYLEGPAA